MKSVKKVGIEKFNEIEFDKMNELVGGSGTKGVFPSATTTQTRDTLWDKDSVSDSDIYKDIVS